MDHDMHFTPEMVIASATEPHGLGVEQLGVAPVAVLSWSMKVVRSLAEAIGAELSKHWMYRERHPLYTGEVAGRRVTLAHVPVGAPGTVMMMEEMVAAGARAFWGLGAGGSLQEDAPVGTCIIPTSAVSEEPGTPLIPAPQLVTIAMESCQAEGLAALNGRVWTTDAPYRETHAKIRAYQQQGVLVVDMETSAMYALGEVRGVAVCNLLVVSDELWRAWRFGGPGFDDARRRATKAVLRCAAATPTAPRPPN